MHAYQIWNKTKLFMISICIFIFWIWYAFQIHSFNNYTDICYPSNTEFIIMANTNTLLLFEKKYK